MVDDPNDDSVPLHLDSLTQLLKLASGGTFTLDMGRREVAVELKREAVRRATLRGALQRPAR